MFDEAFQSRIHVSLRYQDLSSDAKRQIWVAFLKRVNGSIPNGGLSHDELHTLGEKKVNGRQIKNIVKTAGALALGRQEVCELRGWGAAAGRVPVPVGGARGLVFGRED